MTLPLNLLVDTIVVERSCLMSIHLKWRTASVVGTLAAVSVALLPAGAQARDSSPCGPSHHVTSSKYTGPAQSCQLWRGGVPVYASAEGSSAVVGHLWDGGDANWFVFQTRCGQYRYQSLANDWWAYTEADNGRFGYVPEVFFKGGSNWEQDGGLTVGETGPAPHLFAHGQAGTCA